MLDVTNILFPTDLSIMCSAFAWQVAMLVGRLDANLTLLHIDRTRSARDGSAAGARFADFSHVLSERMRKERMSRMVLAGDVVSNILDRAQSEEIDLIMMPTNSGGGRIRRLLSPSILEKTLRHCSCAVWTANGLYAAVCPQFRNIVCAVDLDSDTSRVVSTAGTLASQLGSHLSIVHVLPPRDESLLHLAASHDLPVVGTETAAMSELTAIRGRLDTLADIYVETGETKSGVENILRKIRADLLVIGPGRHSRETGRLGTNVLPLVHSASCPVLVISKVGATALPSSLLEASWPGLVRQ